MYWYSSSSPESYSALAEQEDEQDEEDDDIDYSDEEDESQGRTQYAEASENFASEMRQAASAEPQKLYEPPISCHVKRSVYIFEPCQMHKKYTSYYSWFWRAST